jgi:hypothetical protein
MLGLLDFLPYIPKAVRVSTIRLQTKLKQSVLWKISDKGIPMPTIMCLHTISQVTEILL